MTLKHQLVFWVVLVSEQSFLGPDAFRPRGDGITFELLLGVAAFRGCCLDLSKAAFKHPFSLSVEGPPPPGSRDSSAEQGRDAALATGSLLANSLLQQPG